MDRLPRDILVLIFDVVQTITGRAHDLCLVSKRWAAIISSLRNRYPPRLHHTTVLVVEESRGIDFFFRLQTGPLPPPVILRGGYDFSSHVRHRGTSVHLLQPQPAREQYHLITSPVIDVVLIPITVRRDNYVQLLSAGSHIRRCWPMPTRVRVIVVVTDVDTLGKLAEQEFLTFCAYFDAALRLAPHVLEMRTFVPITTYGLNDGVYNRAAQLDWYHGPTLMDALCELSFTAPALPIADAPLLLVCSPARRETGHTEVWVRVFRRKLRIGRIVYLLQEPLEVRDIDTRSGVACEGDVVLVTLAGAAASTCAVGDVLDGGGVSPEAYKMNVLCNLSVRELPQPNPLLTAGFSFVLRMHLAVVPGEVVKLLALLSSDGKISKRSPIFVKSKSRVICRLQLSQQVWLFADNEPTVSAFSSFILEYAGEVIAHGRPILDRSQSPSVLEPAQQLPVAAPVVDGAEPHP